MILQRTTTALHVIVRQLPVDLEGVPTGRRAAAAASPFCLSRGASAVPYERCSNAIASISTPDLPHEVMCTELRTVITGSLATKGSSTPESEALLAGAGMPPAFLESVERQPPPSKLQSRTYSRRSGQQLNPSKLAETDPIRLRQRVSLIQGPAGTGKQRLLAALWRLLCVSIRQSRAMQIRRHHDPFSLSPLRTSPPTSCSKAWEGDWRACHTCGSDGECA